MPPCVGQPRDIHHSPKTVLNVNVLQQPNIMTQLGCHCRDEDTIHVVEKCGCLTSWHGAVEFIAAKRQRTQQEIVQKLNDAFKLNLAPNEKDLNLTITKIKELLKKSDIRVIGLHAHLGSGNLDGKIWAETALFLTNLLPDFPEVSCPHRSNLTACDD